MKKNLLFVLAAPSRGRRCQWARQRPPSRIEAWRRGALHGARGYRG
jgi:hypothetical protein